MAYNISAFAGAGAQFFDANGTPLAGGLLYVYAAGTTTPATTWTTNSGAVANTNPIVLDSAGRTPNEIWLNSGLTYKFILKDSADVLIGTYDNIPAIDDPTVFNDLITVTGTDTLLGTATPPITGYVTGATYSFVVPNTNTGAVTISIDGLGAKEITYAGSTVLIPGQLVANSIAVIEYDGTRFQLMQSSASIATVASLNVTNNATIGGNTSTASLTVNSNNISAVNSLGFRNRIINGDMRIDQRNAGASVTPTVSSTYTLDRWITFLSQASKYSVQQNAGSVTPPAGFVNYLGCTSLSAYTVGTSEQFGIAQGVEGFNIADLAWGTASARSVTLSFWVRSSLTGTFGGSINNNGNTRCYPYTYTISSANTWEYKTVTISGDTTGTWLTNNGVGLTLRFSLGAGATVSGTAGAWSGTTYYSATGATSVVGTNGATFYITGVQLEAGAVATPFERRPFGTELALCQRYFEKSYPQSVVADGSAGITDGAVFYGLNTSDAVGANFFKVVKRTSPTIAFYAPPGGSGSGSVRNNSSSLAITGCSASDVSEYGWNRLTKVGGLASGNQYSAQFTASSEL